MKRKKIIAVVLSIVLLFSSLGAVSAAVAAENNSMDKLRESINAVTTLKDFTGVEVVKSFNTLTAAERDTLGAEYILKIYQLAYNEAEGTAEEKSIAAKELLGDYTTAMQEAITLRSYLVKEMGQKIQVTVDGVPFAWVLEANTFSYTGDVTGWGQGSEGNITISKEQQNAILDEAIRMYSDASDAVKDYANIINNEGIIGGVGTNSLASIRLVMNVIARAANTSLKSWEAFAAENDMNPLKPTDPSSTLQGDTAYDIWKAGFSGWESIISMGSWLDFMLTDAMAQDLVGMTKAEAIAALPAKKIEQKEKEAAHKIWVEKQPEYQQYLNDTALYQQNQNLYGAYKTDERIKALNTIKMSAQAKEAMDAAYKIFEIYNEYAADKSNPEKEKAVVDAYDSLYENLSSFQKNQVLSQYGSINFYYLDGQDRSIPGALTIAQSVKDNSAYQEFCAYVSEMDLITERSFENNKIITDLKERYNKINRNLIRNFQKDYPEAYAKYNTNISMWRYVYPTDKAAPVHDEGFQSESVALNQERNLAGIAGMLLPQTNGLASVLLGSITGNPTAAQGAYQGIFTNDNVTFLVKTLYTFLADLEIEGFPITLSFPPEEIGKLLNVEIEGYEGRQFENARQALLNAPSWDAVDKIDWEIEDNNYDQFADAFIASLRPITNLLALIQLNFTNSQSYASYDPNSATQDFRYGVYEQVIIPLVETLGGEVTLTSDEYTAAVRELRNENIDAQFKLAFDQFKPIVQKLLANPVDYLAGVLPNLMYHLQDGCIFEGIKEVASSLGLGIGEIDAIKNLSWNSIVSLLDPLLAGTGITLADLELEKLAKLGKATQKNSARANTDTVIYVEADKESVYNFFANLIDEMLVKFGVVDLGTKTEFVKTAMPQYPHNGKMDQSVMNAMINGLDGLLAGFVNINDLINSNLCTNVMAAQAVQAIYGALGDLDLDILSFGIDTSPDTLAKALKNESKYIELARELTGMASWDDVSLYLANGDTVVYQADMGFEDGDRQGFVDSLTACLRPLVKAMADANVLVNTQRADGTTAYGLYDLVIVPLLEDLGLSPTKSDTYTSNFNKLIKKADTGAAYDYLIRTILDPLLGLVDQFAAAPAKTLMNLLPNLAYQVQHGELLGIVSGIPGLSGGNGKIDLAGILNGLLSNLLPGFELPAFDLDTLANCGTFTEKSSKSTLRSTYTTVSANSADAFVTLFYYLYDAINYKDNLAIIKTALSGIEGVDETLGGMLESIFNEVFTQGKEEALCALGTLLASDVWVCPTADGNNGGKTPSTGDYAIPATVFLMMAVAAGGAIFLLKRKKAII